MGDNMDRAEFDRIKQMENEILRGRPVGSVTNGGYGKPNGLTPEQTIGFINKQSDEDYAWKVAQAFYNGSWNMLERGVLGSLAMLRDNNIENLQAQGIEVGDGGKYIDMALNSDHLQPYEVKGNTQLGQLGLDLAQGTGQLAVQAALALTTGGVGSTVAMGASIAGNQYVDLRKEGVPVDRATRASVINAGVQAPLERLSIGNILSKLPAGSGLRQKVVQVAQNAITEGMTEYIQQYPEEITNIYAKNGGNVEELVNKTLEQLPEIHRNGLYAGLIGAVLGGGAGAINVAVRRNVNAAQLEAVENRVEQARKTGITPEAYANTVNNNMPESTVSVDGDVLLGWMQSGNADEMAQMLGVTVNEVQQAADEGLTVELAQGSYEGTAMKYADFLPTMRDHTAFEVGGFMQSDAPGQKELQKEYQSFDDTETALQAQIDKIAESMQQAGMNAKQRAQAIAALTSYARTQRPDNPASIFEEYPITFQRGDDNGGGYNQAAVIVTDKEKQLAIIEATNPMTDDYHTGIRTVEDILTAEEALGEGSFEGLYDDFTEEMAQKALETGEVTVYSSKPIAAGTFVSTSKMNAQDYAGQSGKVYSKKISIKDLAWIDESEGQYAPIAEYEKYSRNEPEGNLVAYHNTNEKALMSALEAGGLAVPSIAITNREFDYDNFGNITLVGTRDLIDPANNTDVYNRDAYTTRTPRTEYKKMKSADVREFIKKWEKEFEKIDERAFQELRYHLENGNMRSAYDTFVYSRALKYYYLTNVREEKIELPRENLLKDDIFKDEQFTEELKEIIQNREDYTDAELHKTITEKATAAVLRLWGDDSTLVEVMTDVYSNPDEHYKLLQELRNDLRNSQKPVDTYAFDRLIDSKYRSIVNSNDYMRWAKKHFEQYAGEPQLKIGSKYYPYNLENLVKAMLKKKGKGKEDTLTYSSSVVAANAARKFKSVDEIRKYADQLGKSEDVEKQIDEINELAGEYQRLVAPYYKYGASSFDVFDDSMKALSKSMTVNADSTASKLKRALESLDFENVPDDVIETGVKVANALKHAATQYFEAKPQRAVRIEEFAGAVVPKGTNPELITRLKDAGLRVEEYDKNEPGARRAATRRAQSAGANVFFQSANEGNRGSIYWNNEGQAIVQLFEAADASTFIHEATGHYFANVLAKEAAKANAPEQIVKDFNTMLNYAGTTRERWDYLNSKPRHQLTEAEDEELVKIQEAWATAAEQYFLEGKAPNRELQPVFNRFKKWLLDIYKSIEQFAKTNKYAVPITDEVRQVFDRMLASEQQITEMEKLNGYYAKLPKTITDNLSDSYKTRLYNAMAKAHDKAVQLLTAKSLENFTAERKERIQQYREEIRPKVTEAVDNEPLYTASRQLLEDNSKYKDVKAYVNHYYDLLNRSTDIEAKPLTEAEETEVMTFDLTAETNGFESGDALAKAILESPTRQQAITQRLNDEVQKRFPDIYKERRLAEAAAQEAFYNDDAGEVLGLEEQIIEDAAKKTLDQQRSAEQQRQLAQMKRQQAKVQAQGYLRSVPLREALRITKYVTAERRAAANAATALAKGDYDTALDYKHKQLLAHQMVRESINMNRRYAQYGKFLSRQRKMKKENWGNEENFMQVGALFARMGLRIRGYDERLKQQSLREWADVMQEDYDNVAIADWIYNESRTFMRPLSDLTFDEYEDVVNALKNIRAVVKTQTMMQGEAKAQSFAETKDAGMEALDKLPTKYTPDVNKKGKAKAIDNFARQLRNSDNLFEMLDNWTYGWFSKHFGEVVRKCADVEAELTMKYEDATRQAYKEWLPDKAARKAADKLVRYEELGASVNKHTLIKLAINLGNESNAKKLCSTATNSTYREFFGNSQLWVDGDVIQIKKNLLEFLGRVLTAEDWRYAQKKIDIANMFWQQMSELEYRDKGFRPPKVEAYPEIITLADGQQIVFRGGYFPLIRRRDTGSHPASQDAIPSTTGGRPGDSIRTLHTNTGHTKARDNSIYPIDLTPGGEFAVAMDTIHDIAYRETMNNFRKLMNDREFYNKLKEKLGIADMEALEEFLKKAAQPYGGSGFATLSERDTGRLMSWLRSKTVNAAIMLNFKTSLQNLGNPLLYGRVVDGFGYADVLAAYANYQKNWQGRKGFYAMRDFVYSKSVFMRERGQLPDISLRDMKDEGTELNPIEKRTIKWGTQMLTFTDELSALPVWLQAYQKKINTNATEDEAVQFANTVIRRTLGSSRITDVAPIQRGGPLMKLITTFQGFFNTQYNQWNREFNIVRRAWGEKQYGTVVGRVSAFAASKFLLFNLINLALAFENPLGDDDDDGWPKIATELLHYPISLLGPVGGVANAMLNNMLDIKDYGYSMTVIEGSLDKMFKAGKLVGDIASGDKEISDAAEPVAGVAAMAAGIPNQLTKLFFNAWDILYNDMEAEPRDLFYRRPARDR